VISFAPSGASASLTAFITAPGAPAVPASPAPFAPSSESAVGVTHVPDLDVRHLGRHRHEVVRHVAVQHLPALVIEAVLEQRGTESLHHAAAYLLVDELRIDHRAAVFHTTSASTV